MAQTITNQASLSFQYNGVTGSALSNIASASLTEQLAAVKYSVQSTYEAGQELTYTVSLINSGATALTDVTVTDNLGTYQSGGVNVTPLTISQLALLFINGAYSGQLTPEPGINSIEFTIPSLPAGANAQIVYVVSLNANAPLETGSEITNTVTVSSAQLPETVTATNTVTAADYADVRISKSMAPATVTDGSAITYGFTIYNYGNTEATNIVLTDAFNPAPGAISVQVDGTTLAPTLYTYAGGTLTLPTGSYSLSLPPATFTTDPVTGAVTTTPSSLDITVTGTL